MTYHLPALSTESLKILEVNPHKIYIDATLGHGGHSQKILSLGATVYAIDQDLTNIKIAQKRLQKKFPHKFFTIHDNFSNLEKIIKNNIKTPQKIGGLIFDLGLSVNQQKSVNRGFSFNDPDSLDMRLDPLSTPLTAEMIINTYSGPELSRIFSFYAQEKLAIPLSQEIVRQRQITPIKTGLHLSSIVNSFYQKRSIKTKINPSTKIFLALRIVVNQEFDNLKKALNQTLSCLPPLCKVVVISFHSGEDRLVKQFISGHFSKIKKLTTKAIQASPLEVRKNPLSRSALLRAYQIKS